LSWINCFNHCVQQWQQWFNFVGSSIGLIIILFKNKLISCDKIVTYDSIKATSLASQLFISFLISAVLNWMCYSKERKDSSLLIISFNLRAYFKQAFFIVCGNKNLQHCFKLHIKNFMANLTSLNNWLIKKTCKFHFHVALKYI
jgi:hypothetical protein